jgi:hypothetical protein
MLVEFIRGGISVINSGRKTANHESKPPFLLISLLRYFILLAIFLLLHGCAPLPEIPTEAVPTQAIPLLKASITPEIKTPAEATTPISPSALPGLQLPAADQVVFSIPNPEPWSGKEGDSRPDWKGWGAQTFIVAPGGTFWLADTAVFPNRLLHYSRQGELLQEISLEEQVVYAFDLAIAQDSLWVLDISAIQPKVIRLSLDGDILSNVEVPAETFCLLVGEENELLLFGLSGYMELIDAAGEITQRHLDALSYYGHTYQAGAYNEASGQVPIYVDGAPVDIPPDFFIEAEPFTGFYPDGSFALAGYVQEADGSADRQVRTYNASGELLGTARQYPQTFYKDWNHHLASGPDGAIYQLLSNPDHSVQIVRLGFTADLPAITATPSATPSPLTTLQPSVAAATDEEQARNALLEFFAHLSSGDYADAAALFGGEMSEYAREPMPGETVAAYWEYICNFLWCLPVAEITEVEQISESEYLFLVVFRMQDGTRFEIGACCGGDPAATPPVWQFAYPVRKIDGTWKVMRAPLFTP